jgi:hypothetical protein
LHCLGLTQFISVFLRHRFGLCSRSFYGTLLAYVDGNPETLLGQEYKVAANTIDQAMHGGAWGTV